MTLLFNLPSSSTVLAAGAPIVGATFVWTGIIKALEPHVFQRHLVNLGWIQPKHAYRSLITVAGLEAGWGAALILGVMPRLLLSATVLLLVALTVVSTWGVRTGRTTDCGCYGGYVVPSLTQSLLLNGTFVGLTLATWIVRRNAGPTPVWKLAAAIAVGAGVAILARTSINFLAKHGRFMVDLNPLKIGGRWHGRWGAPISDDGGEHLVSYLGLECPHCKRWIRVLNAIDQASGLPSVVGIVGASSEQLPAFIANSGIRFPMRTIPTTLMNRLAWRVPTTVLVSGGRIQNKWGGQMPPEFFERFRDAFFPGVEDRPLTMEGDRATAPASSAPVADSA